MKNSRNLLLRLAFAAPVVAALAGVASAQQVTVHVSIKDHRFSPSEVQAPANTPITIVVKNLDPTPEEFESKMLRVEKIIAGGGSGVFHIRPLNAGRYRFFGEFHEDTAEGYLVVE